MPMAKTADQSGLTHDAAPVAVNTPRHETVSPHTSVRTARELAALPPSDGVSTPRATQVIRRMPAGSGATRARMMNGLQAATGNARVGRLAIQAKLAVSQPGDPYEREAEHVATKVALMPAPASDAPTTREGSASQDQAGARPPATVARLAHPDSAEAGDPRDRHIPAAQPGAHPGEERVQRRMGEEPAERPPSPRRSQ